jgi:hypothetical protein
MTKIAKDVIENVFAYNVIIELIMEMNVEMSALIVRETQDIVIYLEYVITKMIYVMILLLQVKNVINLVQI